MRRRRLADGHGARLTRHSDAGERQYFCLTRFAGLPARRQRLARPLLDQAEVDLAVLDAGLQHHDAHRGRRGGTRGRVRSPVSVLRIGSKW